MRADSWVSFLFWERLNVLACLLRYSLSNEPCKLCPLSAYRSPRSVVYLRLASAIAVGTVLVADFSRPGKPWPVIYFTKWNFALIFLTICLGIVRQVLAIRGRCCRLLAQVHGGMFATILTFAPMVTFITWAVLCPQSISVGKPWKYLNTISYCEHIGNTVVCVAEFLFVKPQLPWPLVACPVLFSTMFF